MSTQVREPETQTFVEAALKLGGKSEEEARTTGTVDRADDQVDALFDARYQTANSPLEYSLASGAELVIHVVPPEPPNHEAIKDAALRPPRLKRDSEYRPQRMANP